MIKNVSIAYCGGCNAGYDRVEFVRDLINAVEGAGVVLNIVPTDEPCDMALIMAGCQALCVSDREDLGSRAAVRHVVGPEKLDAVTMPFPEIHERLKAELLAASSAEQAAPGHFCSCQVHECLRHPSQHDEGCDPCIQHNLRKKKMPACMFKAVHDDVSNVTDFTIKGFVDFFRQHEE